MAEDIGGSYFGDRWSYHLARPPGGASDFGDQGFLDWLKRSIYDRPELDPNATFAAYVNEYRQTAADLGVRADETDMNVMYAVYLLETGQTDWRAIAVEAGSAPTTSGEAPLLDVLETQQQKAIDAYRTSVVAAGGEPDSSDAPILATLESIGAVTFQIPESGDLQLSAVYAQPPEPLRDEAQDRNTSGSTQPSQYSGLSSFSGFGPSGSIYSGGQTPQSMMMTSAAPVGATGGGMDRNTLLVLIVLAIGGFFLLQQGKR